MKVFFPNPQIYFDTSVAPLEAIMYVLQHVGATQVIFGTDVSGTRMPFFYFPKVELDKLRQLNLDGESMRLILAGNIESLVKG